jgi:hypothetical protein
VALLIAGVLGDRTRKLIQFSLIFALILSTNPCTAANYPTKLPLNDDCSIPDKSSSPTIFDPQETAQTITLASSRQSLLLEPSISLQASDINSEPDVKPISDKGSTIHADSQQLGLIGGIAIAGLMVMPMDKILSKKIIAVPVSGNGRPLTEFANSLGTPMALLPAIGGMYFLGNSYDKESAKQAISALFNVGVYTQGLKYIAGRARPLVKGEAGEFEGPGAGKGYSSFPSGHTASAFAVATVAARRYPKRKWLFYGLAAAVGIARIQKSAHFPSDVLFGMGLGIYTGNQAVSKGPNLLTYRF